MAANAPSKFCDAKRAERGRPGLWVDSHDRLIDGDLGDSRCHQHDAVSERAGESRHVAPLPPDVVAAVAARIHDQFEVAATQGVGSPFQHLGAKGLDVGDQHPDHIRALRAQAASDEAGLVAEIRDDGFDPVERGRRHAIASVDGTRNGSDRDTGTFGDIADRHPVEQAVARTRRVVVHVPIHLPQSVLQSLSRTFTTLLLSAFRVCKRGGNRRRCEISDDTLWPVNGAACETWHHHRSQRHLEFGQVDDRVCAPDPAGMHRVIAAIAATGNNVVADHVLLDPSCVTDCARVLADLPAYFGVRCPLEVVEARDASGRTAHSAPLATTWIVEGTAFVGAVLMAAGPDEAHPASNDCRALCCSRRGRKSRAASRGREVRHTVEFGVTPRPPCPFRCCVSSPSGRRHRGSFRFRRGSCRAWTWRGS